MLNSILCGGTPGARSTNGTVVSFKNAVEGSVLGSLAQEKTSSPVEQNENIPSPYIVDKMEKHP